MKKMALLIAIVIGFSTIGTGVAQEKPTKGKPEAPKVVQKSPQEIAEHLQEISVTIRSGDGASHSEGSGVIFNRKIEGEDVSFVWTAAHVVDNLKTSREVVDPESGTNRKKITFKDVQIVKELVQDGRRVGEVVMEAEVIKFSDPSTGHDLALLMVRKRGFGDGASAVFYLDDDIPPIGTQVLHVGSLLGQMGANSMTDGIVSQIGRTISSVESKVVFDQTTAAAFPGSSGGGVYLTDGRYIGMLVRGAGESFNLIVPMRRLKDWCEKHDLLWAIDPTAKAPTLEEIKDIVVDDVTFGSKLKDEHGEEKSNGFYLHRYEVKPIDRVVPTIEELLD